MGALTKQIAAVGRRIDGQIDLMVELRVGQGVLNQQIAATDQAVVSLANSVSRLLPIIETHELRLDEQNQRLEEQNQRLEEQNRRLDEQNESIREGNRRIEDLYRSQAHYLRRLFGETDDSDPPAQP